MSAIRTLCFLPACMAVLLLAACGGIPLSSGGGKETNPVVSIDRPMSEQPATTEYRRNAKVHVELGTAYVEGEQLGVALDEARHAIAYDKGYAPAHVLMGKVFALLTQYSQAEAAFAEAVRLAPGDPEVNSEYGWYLCSRDRFSQGVQRLEAALGNPYFKNPARALGLLGFCHIRAKDYVAAERALSQSYQRDPQNLRVIYQLAEVALRADALPRAREFANELAAKLSPGATPESVWLSLRIERKMGNRVAETKLANQLARDYPASAEYQSYLQGKFE
ncbi:type IV pilus biogenesis/stability protein PilW [Viridibacterium curvum]|uniref:Type IV pilus biogenesis/stability protein PilW n=1 Tax=Viridibacterium curvum TaxID=1101404 RepID=A0ABP9R209_9RHOO